jgi:hypothetical protein
MLSSCKLRPPIWHEEKLPQRNNQPSSLINDDMPPLNQAVTIESAPANLLQYILDRM